MKCVTSSCFGKSSTQQNRQGGFKNMRNFRKLTTAVLAVALVLTSMTAVFAADSATLANADKAATLKDLGLYSGQDANDPKVGLENALTTQDSLIFLAKLFGYYDTATKLADDQVAQALAKFDDAASISDYAKNVVAYSAANSILNGSTQAGKFFVGANDTVTAARFATFMLRQMGYQVADYRQSVATLAETKGSKIDAIITGDLTRDAAVGMMYGALTAEKASGKTVIIDIAGDNAELKTKAEKLGLVQPIPNKTNDSNYYSFTPLDSTPPEVNVQLCCAVPENGTIYIIYSEAMNEAQMLNKGKYQVSINQGDTYMNLGDDDTITKVNDRTVRIYFKELEGESINPYVKIAPIIDLAGNRLYSSLQPYTVENIEPENVYIEEAQLIAKDRIKLVFNKEMGIINVGDITFTNLSTDVTFGTPTINSEGKTEVVLSLIENIATDATDGQGNSIRITTVAEPSSVSEWGGKLRSQFSIELEDKTAPEIVMWDHDNDESTADIAKVIAGGDIASPQIYSNDYTVPKDITGTITIYFSENIKESDLTVQKFNVTGFTITNITASTEPKTVVLAVKANADNTPVMTTVYQILKISDTAGNELDPGSPWSVTLENKTT